MATTRALAARTTTFTPEMFGAKGDGRTNDTLAMANLAIAVTIASGGTVIFRNTTYIVGMQDGDDVLAFTGCTDPLVIQGNGARIRCADGLRYGVFDPASGEPVQPKMPYFGPGRTSPYRNMIRVQGCTGPVTIADLELDGNLDRLMLGGPWGDTGWQIGATGLTLRDNSGAEIVSNLHTHHHAQDGFAINGVDPAPPAHARRMTNVRAEHNGRQGCSITGGHGYLFDGCSFAHTARGPIVSKPGAGVDLEAEGGKVNSGFAFVNCVFDDNYGPGFVADTGPSADVTFTSCKFVGTIDWAVWPNKPGIRFSQCSFTGAFAKAFGDPDRARATRFDDCVFDDDPRHSSTGKVYGGTNTDRPLADLSDALNIQFNRCRFLALHGSVMPWSKHAIYKDCTMQQTAPGLSFPRGTYEGHSVATGNISPTFSTMTGVLLLNGKSFGRP